MPSIVLEFQNEIIMSNSRLTDLLRKGLLIAKKLKLSEFENWIINELDGYKSMEYLPEYRKLQGLLYFSNPYTGTRPVGISNGDLEKTITTRPMFYSVSELEAMSKKQKEDGGSFEVVFPGGMQLKLQEMCGCSSDYRFVLHLQIYQIEGIVDAVRNTLLKWALQLGEDGILGDGIVFSDKEKEAAALPRYSTVNYFYAPVQNSQIQQQTQGSTQSLTVEQVDFEKIKETVQDILTKLDTLGVEGSQKEDLGVELQTMFSQLKSSNPKIGVLRECWASARNILEGVTGGLIASGLAVKIQWLSELLKSKPG
ncbi:hypothetical protein [Pelosinus sp. UFO1]|uniref:AbiTii domain-containing protein n=1 Tax=Pelosinus sp. UFO1 TaxID=484770 RepID=UPI0004D1AD24|nr:hypothetical protein [Pelosinus sp. UFO1]AIF51242.1 hypothetical protein UFO1_1691 [Pelosinus sp. UFO1]